jgi:hypothetical protein
MKNLILFINLGVALVGTTGCIKQEQTTAAPPQSPPTARQLTTTERIAEIDRELAAPLTGTPEDASRRTALRAERSALAGEPRLAQHQVYARQQQQLAQQQQQATAEAQAHQRTVDQLKFEAEQSKLAERQRLQAQRDQWEKEDRLLSRRLNGNYHPEAPPQNTYDVQITDQHSRDGRDHH